MKNKSSETGSTGGPLPAVRFTPLFYHQSKNQMIYFILSIEVLACAPIYLIAEQAVKGSLKVIYCL